MNPTATENKPADPYASRFAVEGEIVARKDPTVWGDRPGPLTDQQLAQFDRDGYCFEPDLFEPQHAEALRDEADRLARTADPRQAGIISEPGSKVVRSIFRVHRTNELFRSVCCDGRIVARAEQILGGKVYIHQSRINFKPALNGKEFFWHSDFETWHIEDGMPRMRAVSVSLNLTANTEFNGPLMVIPGSHRSYVRCVGQTPEDHYKQSLRRQEYGVPGVEALQKLVDQRGIVAPKGEPGSALLFDCNTMHGSTGNLSPHPRTNLFVVYNSVENAVREPFGGSRPRPEFLCERDIVPVDSL